MKKQQFLETLKKEISRLPEAERDEILRDQDEYIRDAIQAGRSEEEVLASLGDPKVFAQNLLAGSKISQAEQSGSLKKQVGLTLSAIVAVLALAPLNLIFVLGPFIGLLGLLIGGWATAAGLLISAIAVLGAFSFKLIFVPVGIWTHFSAFFFALGWIGVGVLVVILMGAITRFFLLGTIAYLKWNVSFVRGRL